MMTMREDMKDFANLLPKVERMFKNQEDYEKEIEEVNKEIGQSKNFLKTFDKRADYMHKLFEYEQNNLAIEKLEDLIKTR